MSDEVVAPGTILAGRWELEARLARGGMGDVFRARDGRLGRAVAIKILRPGPAQAHERFAAEGAILSRLQHPNVVVLFDVGEHDELPFLVMELVEGTTLAERLTGGPLPTEEVQRVGAALASALAYAHDQGVVHRDIKPGNVLFDAARAVKLADFGIARLADAAGITATGVALGTAGYVAPEQLRTDEPVGPPADVYALGLVLLEAATGVRAFDGPVAEAAHARLHRDPAIPEELPSPWPDLLRRMTARTPGERPTAAQVADQLAPGAPPDRSATRLLPQQEPGTRDAAGAGGPYADTELVGAASAAAGRGRATETTTAGGGGRPLLPYLLGALAVVAVVLLVVGVPGTERADDLPSAGEGDADLPAELEEAFETLDRSVRP